MESKPKPIFCIGVPHSFYGDIPKLREQPIMIDIQKEYHVLIFTANDISFQMFNSDKLEPVDIQQIKDYIITKLCH